MAPLPRGRCSVCGRDVALRNKDLVRDHDDGSGAFCDGTGQVASPHGHRDPCACVYYESSDPEDRQYEGALCECGHSLDAHDEYRRCEALVERAS